MAFRKQIASMAALAMLLTLTACGAGNPATPTTPPAPTSLPTSVPTMEPTMEPTVEPTSEPTSVPTGDTSISFEKTGGIAGVQEKVVISTQGQAIYTTRSISRTQALPQATYSALLKQIDAADFFNLKESYDNGNVADDFYYAITVNRGSLTKTVHVAAVGGEDITPQGLKDLIAQLLDVQNTLSSTGTTITFLTSGGFIGLDDSLIITPDRKGVYKSRGAADKKLYLSDEQYNKLLAQIEAADFFNLPDNYQYAASDAFVYTITVAEASRTKTVRATESADLPDGLLKLISQLKELQ